MGKAKEFFSSFGKKAGLLMAQVYKLGFSLKLKFGEIVTDRGTLIYEGELKEGIEVYLAQADDLPSVAPDDTYTTDTQRITVADGRITQIENLDGTEFDTPPEEAKEITEEAIEQLGDLLETLLDLEETIVQNFSKSRKEDKAKIAELEAKQQKHESDLSALEQKFSEATKPLTNPVNKKPGDGGSSSQHKNFTDYMFNK